MGLRDRMRAANAQAKKDMSRIREDQGARNQQLRDGLSAERDRYAEDRQERAEAWADRKGDLADEREADRQERAYVYANQRGVVTNPVRAAEERKVRRAEWQAMSEDERAAWLAQQS